MKTLLLIILFASLISAQCLNSLRIRRTQSSVVASENNDRATITQKYYMYMIGTYGCPGGWMAFHKSVTVAPQDTCNTRVISSSSGTVNQYNNCTLTVTVEANVYDYPAVDSLNRVGPGLLELTLNYYDGSGSGTEDFEYGSQLSTSSNILVPKHDDVPVEDPMVRNISAISITPNPFTIGTNIIVKGILPTVIDIYDISGVLVDSYKNVNSVFWSKASQQAGSIFFIRVKQGRKSFCKKLICVP